MPWALSGPARVASGTLDGLTTIQGLADFPQPPNQETLAQFLTTFFAKPPNAKVTTVVTGHSLGGCLASIVAMWIRTLPLPNCQGTIQPITFAAPTAGNGNFAKYYNELFPSARRFQNTLDVIPLAYYNLNLIDSIYGGLLPTPDFVKVGLALMQESIAGLGYTQPAQGQQILPGTQLASDTDWYAQALHQHHLATYLAILTGTPVDRSALPQPSVARAKEGPAGRTHRLRSIEGKLARSLRRERTRARFHVAAAGLRQLPAEHARCNKRTQHLRGAAADREHAHVARHALKRKIARIAARAEHLQRIVNDADRGFARED